MVNRAVVDEKCFIDNRNRCTQVRQRPTEASQDLFVGDVVPARLNSLLDSGQGKFRIVQPDEDEKHRIAGGPRSLQEFELGTMRIREHRLRAKRDASNQVRLSQLFGCLKRQTIGLQRPWSPVAEIRCDDIGVDERKPEGPEIGFEEGRLTGTVRPRQEDQDRGVATYRVPSGTKRRPLRRPGLRLPSDDT